MCEANVYMLGNDGTTSLFFDSVDRVVPLEGGRILLENIYGERKTVTARIKWMELVDHRVVIGAKDTPCPPGIKEEDFPAP
jgi:predicted RNA-binding protein